MLRWSVHRFVTNERPNKFEIKAISSDDLLVWLAVTDFSVSVREVAGLPVLDVHRNNGSAWGYALSTEADQ